MKEEVDSSFRATVKIEEEEKNQFLTSRQVIAALYNQSSRTCCYTLRNICNLCKSSICNS